MVARCKSCEPIELPQRSKSRRILAHFRAAPSSNGSEVNGARNASSLACFGLHLGSAVSGPSRLRFLPRVAIANHLDSPPETFQTNVWQHVVAIYQPSTNGIRSFLNGQELPLVGLASKPSVPDNFYPPDGECVQTRRWHSKAVWTAFSSTIALDAEAKALFQLAD